MTKRLRLLWSRLRATYWFLPGVMAFGAGLLAVLLPEIDDILQVGLVADISREGARTLLSTLAGASLTVATVAFSTIIVALTLTSQQFGPQLLLGFMKMRSNQLVLGTFLGTFTYSLLALWMLSSRTDVPDLSVAAAFGLAVANVFVLIYFIHNASVSIHASEIIQRAASDLEHALTSAFPEARPDNAVDAKGLDAVGEPQRVVAEGTGYLADTDVSGLLKIARNADTCLHVQPRVGDFLVPGDSLVEIPGGPLDDNGISAVRSAFILTSKRVSERDAHATLDALVAIAVRALSPGINDPYTAIRCLDRLGQLVADAASRPRPPRARLDDDGRLRVVLPSMSVVPLVASIVDPVLHYGRTDPLIPPRLLDLLAFISSRVSDDSLRRAIAWHAESVYEIAGQAPMAAPAKARLQAAWRRFRAVIPE